MFENDALVRSYSDSVVGVYAVDKVSSFKVIPR
jgi:hypothetical protein